MKKIVTAAIIVAAAFFSLAAHADQAKLDGLLNMTIAQPAVGKTAMGKAITVEAGREMVSCLLKSSDPELTRAAIEEAGGRTNAVIGKIMSVSIPTDSILKISDLDEVEYIEAAKPMTKR